MSLQSPWLGSILQRMRFQPLWLYLVSPYVALAVVACARAESTDAAEPHKPETIPTEPALQWGEVGCEPLGAELRFEAKLEVEPARSEGSRGKSFRGVWLNQVGGGRFLISYGHHDFWLPLEGRSLLVEGRRCQKLGQSVGADHFLIEVLRAWKD